MGLGIREARAGLSELVKRVAYGRQEVRIGNRGGDETTLIATAELELLRRRVRDLETGRGEAEETPFSGLMERVRAGEFMPAGERPPRRRIPGIRQENGLSREEMARLGAMGSAEPRFRRTRPRAAE